MVLDSSKILIGVTAKEYCESVGNSLSDYTLKGVHFHSFKGESPVEGLLKKVRENIDNVEVIVNYSEQIVYRGARATESTLFITAHGVALCPAQ